MEKTIINLKDLQWKFLEKLAQAKPMDVRKARESLRSQIILVASKKNCPKLGQWAMGLSDSALDYITHIGFSEEAFWQMLCGNAGDVEKRVGFVNGEVSILNVIGETNEGWHKVNLN